MEFIIISVQNILNWKAIASKDLIEELYPINSQYTIVTIDNIAFRIE